VKTETNFASVEEAVAAAEARAAEVAAQGKPNLIDAIPPEDFANWDGTDEIALVGPTPRAKA
jgi:hypothetical protein